MRPHFLNIAGFVLLTWLAVCVPVHAVPLDDMDFQSTMPVHAELENALDMINRGLYTEAVSQVRGYLLKEPASAAAHEILGVALVKLGSLDGGLQSFNKAIELSPSQSSAMTKTGDVYLAQGRDEDALEMFLKAVSIDPSDHRAHQRLGILYERRGEIAGAVEHYERGLIGTPDDYVGIKVDLAKLYNQQQRADAAVALLEPVIMEDYPGVTAHIVLGTAYLQQNKMEQALRSFSRARDLSPDHEGGYFSLGIAYRLTEQYPESIAALQQVVRLRPEWPAGYLQLAESYDRAGLTDDAVNQYLEADKRGGLPAASAERLGVLLIGQGRHGEGAAYLEQALAGGALSLALLDSLASYYQLTGQFNQAEELLQMGVEKFPKDPFSHYRLGNFQGFVRDYDAAIISLVEARKLRPEHTGILQSLALAYHQSGQLQKAAETGRHLVQLLPEDPGTNVLLASFEQDLGNLNTAIKLLQRVVDNHPTHVIAQNNLAALFSLTGKPDKALPHARQAVELAPNNGAILDTLGWTYYLLANMPAAHENLSKAVLHAPENPVPAYHLAVVLNALGQQADAINSLIRALSIEKSFSQRQEAEALLAQLKEKGH